MFLPTIDSGGINYLLSRKKKIMSSPSLANISVTRIDNCFFFSGTKGRKRLHKACKGLFTQTFWGVYYATGINFYMGPKKMQ